MSSNKESQLALYLAREGLKHYLRYEKYLEPPEEMPPLFYTKRGTFVSLKEKDDNLRGCIGTLEATQNNLAQEIIQNAVSAGVRDPRFPPVKLTELDDIKVSVDIISPLEKVSGLDQLDPSKYGLVVEKGYRRGVLLPDLEGINTPKEQLAISAQKAGLSPSDSNLTLYRFEVTRFHETAS
ncbi:AmmeMemoRadiSam system protein A [Natranaerobius thermophilus JW/NM-WN-LF]|uniref:AMMECR1 domain protein n=1 Tax=Natranaerobius thermophilus (strain ATCC BAA-1301 / DSM 18059 / JW/NM-WN-LF) TaxID=457570 RepID=B2A4R5_NATTJ|nr:AmmeMemoRadiSam system protein A [Natranaerobius thermophilus]ACB83837.1 AMMECR1 domain protein [Natranaerobius thermophilus JW/NM-WN-LF]